MKTYQAITVDPVSQKITYTKNDGSLQAILSDLSFAGHDCAEMESYQLSGRDRMCVDATAALDARLPSFSITNSLGHEITFYGKAVILGTTAEGNPTDAKVVITQFMNRITWGDKDTAFLWKLSDGNVGGAA